MHLIRQAGGRWQRLLVTALCLASGSPAARAPADKVAPALARAGFNIVSLANNHSLDYGPQGLEDTRAALEKAGIQGVGAGRTLAEARAPVYMVKGGTTVAFLAYSLTFPGEFWAGPDRPGTAFGHEQDVRADVTAARTS